MFGKKKAAVEPNKSLRCQVEGCGLTCRDEQSLKRHVAWAHPVAVATKKQA